VLEALCAVHERLEQAEGTLPTRGAENASKRAAASSGRLDAEILVSDRGFQRTATPEAWELVDLQTVHDAIPQAPDGLQEEMHIRRSEVVHEQDPGGSRLEVFEVVKPHR